jgi:hypothetical protein
MMLGADGVLIGSRLVQFRRGGAAGISRRDRRRRR